MCTKRLSCAWIADAVGFRLDRVTTCICPRVFKCSIVRGISPQCHIVKIVLDKTALDTTVLGKPCWTELRWNKTRWARGY